MTVRQAGDAEISRIADMMRRQAQEQAHLFGSFTVSADADWMEHARSHMERNGGAVLIAISGNVVAGYVDVRVPEAAGSSGGLFSRFRAPKKLFDGKTTGYVDDIFVEPPLRRKGVGRLLLASGIEWLGERGASAIEASIAPRNDASMALFRKAGFGTHRIGVRLAF